MNTMEKIEYFLSKKLYIKDTVLYDLIIEISGDIIDAFKNHAYQLSVSLFSVVLFIFQSYNQHLSYLKYAKIDDGFIHYLFPTIIGAILFNTLSNKESVGGRNRFLIFLCSIPLPAFALEYILGSLGVEPSSVWYLLGGLFGYPVLSLSISIYDYTAKELPSILKRVFDIVLSALSNRLGDKKDEPTDDSQTN